MELNGQYLTYNEYKDLGGTLDLTPFNLLEFEARRKIDLKTFNRLKGSNEIPQEVKLCMYELINRINTYNRTNTATGNIASESIDGYSISYNTSSQAGEVIKSKNIDYDDIIRTYLLNVIYNDEHLMYCGVK